MDHHRASPLELPPRLRSVLCSPTPAKITDGMFAPLCRRLLANKSMLMSARVQEVCDPGAAGSISSPGSPQSRPDRVKPSLLRLPLLVVVVPCAIAVCSVGREGAMKDGQVSPVELLEYF